MIVTDITHRLAERKPKERSRNSEHGQGAVANRPAAATDSFSTPMSMGIGGNMLLNGMDEQGLVTGASAGAGVGSYSDIPGQSMMDLDLGLSDWGLADWYPMHFPG